MTIEEKTEIKYVDEPLIWPNKIEYRAYQKRIAEEAKNKNTLIVLPTALGKTVISALVSAHFLYHYKNMRILVMAPTRPLVMQHKESFENFLKLRESDISVLTGKVTGIYRRKVWDGDAKIIFATPQVVKNDLKSENMTLGNFSLLIFDECHRARKDYAYTFVAKKYSEQSGWPIILGMTASPGADNKKIGEICKALYIEHMEHRSEEDEDVAPYVKPIDIDWRMVDLPIEYRDALRIIKEMLDEKLKWLVRTLPRMGFARKPGNINRRELLEIGEKLRYDLGKKPGNKKGPIYSAIVAQSASLTLYHALELLQTQGIHAIKHFLERVESESDVKKSYKALIKNPNYDPLKKMLDKYEHIDHPKLKFLKEEIIKQFQVNPKSKIIVFSQYRDTTSYLVENLKSIQNVSVERFVGQASRLGDLGLKQKDQANILEGFKNGNTNVLVATCIAEEGLDIPSVDLVIFYEPVPSEIRYIQRKGRTGRKVAGRTVILAARDTYDTIYLYLSDRKVKRMKNIMKNLNQELNPIIRLGSKPQQIIMSKEELKEIDDGVELSKNDTISIQSEEEKALRFTKDVDKVAKRVYIILLKAGMKGMLIDDLIEEMSEQEGLSSSMTKGAIDNLEKIEKISKISKDHVAISSATTFTSGKGAYGRNIYEIKIEKVYPGRAVVWINDRWRARVMPHDFEGPESIIKKNTRFRAKGTLYRDEGTLCIRIKEVIELL
ncbi:MAG: helicase-related protein [Candidatus Bathyarchaeota archaeon]|nr:helicase-related protein [Candidatus Bathyarchaeota archaeon]